MRLLLAAVVAGSCGYRRRRLERRGARDAAACRSGTYASPGHAYAGFQSERRGHGIRATLAALEENTVKRGQVPAWVGVGSPRQGPNGADEWLQVGLASFPGWTRNLYYEVKRPGADAAFRVLEEAVPRGESRSVAVLELGDRPNWWRVWMNGRPASQPIHLPGSTRRWQPIATADAWDAGRPTPNGRHWRNFGCRRPRSATASTRLRTS